MESLKMNFVIIELEIPQIKLEWHLKTQEQMKWLILVGLDIQTLIINLNSIC